MQKNRLESFSDCVLSIIITIMVLELKPPQSADVMVLITLLPIFCSYVLSFLFVAIYWTNHHHLLHTIRHVNGLTLWANIHLLFWLSLIPFTTAWVGNFPFTTLPTALYGINLLMSAAAYYLLQRAIIHTQGADAVLAKALGHNIKGKSSLALYISAIGLAFWQPWLADIFFLIVALLWIVPDRRIEKALKEHEAKA